MSEEVNADAKKIDRRNSQKSLKSGGLSVTSDPSGTINRLSVQTSLTSQLTDLSNASFNELVTINDEGHPYIDINRLIFRPVKHHHHHAEDDLHKKEKLSWYIPDFSFIVFNLISLCVSTYFCLIGTSTLTWKASIGMFSIPSCTQLYSGSDYKSPERENNFYFLPCKRFTINAGDEFKAARGYNFQSPNSFPILRTKLTDVHYFGLVLICIELVNVINVVVGINACLQGYKAILIQHIAVDGLIVLGEFIISAVVAFTSVCDPRDLNAIREILKNFVHWYGIIIESPEEESDKEKLINAELDALQIGLGCCGVDGWADYLAARYPESDWYQMRTQLDESEMVIPYSCCRSWWIRNIYCSHGVHLWTHPLASAEMANRFQERIVQEGCMYKLEKLCLNLRNWMGKYGFYATLIHLVFIIIEAISALVLIRNINNLIREKKKVMRRKEMLHDDTGSDLDFSTGRNSLSSGKGKSQWSKVPPPTEDEIMMIKQRSNFNSFMSRVKGGFVGKWMNEAQALVTEGHEDKQEAITAEEKKQREKELLHGKGKQMARDEEDGEGRLGTKDIAKGNRVRKVKGAKDQDGKKVAKKKTDKIQPVATAALPSTEPEGAGLSEATEIIDLAQPAQETESKADGQDKMKNKVKKSFGMAPPPHPPKEKKSAAKVAPPPPPKEKKKKTKVIWKKSQDESQKPIEEEPPAPVVEEPPPLTDEDTNFVTDEAASEEDRHTKRKRRRRRRRRKRGGEKPPWYKNW